jgi:hypothetical protein
MNGTISVWCMLIIYINLWGENINAIKKLQALLDASSEFVWKKRRDKCMYTL